jgi:hypothetical protein
VGNGFSGSGEDLGVDKPRQTIFPNEFPSRTAEVQVNACGSRFAGWVWFVGQVMKATGGKANPGAVNEILRKKLEVSE